MIILLNPTTLSITTYPSLIQCVKENKAFSYYYLKGIPLSKSPTKYKNIILFRVNHSSTIE